MPTWANLTLFVVGAAGVAVSGWHAATLGSPHVDGAGAVIAVYRSAVSSLPERGPLAFIPTSTDPTDAAAIRFLAQYALTPRVLIDDLGAAAAAVTGPSAHASLDARLLPEGLVLVRVAPAGVRVYRRP